MVPSLMSVKGINGQYWALDIEQDAEEMLFNGINEKTNKV